MRSTPTASWSLRTVRQEARECIAEARGTDACSSRDIEQDSEGHISHTSGKLRYIYAEPQDDGMRSAGGYVTCLCDAHGCLPKPGDCIPSPDPWHGPLDFQGQSRTSISNNSNASVSGISGKCGHSSQDDEFRPAKVCKGSSWQNPERSVQQRCHSTLPRSNF